MVYIFTIWKKCITTASHNDEDKASIDLLQLFLVTILILILTMMHLSSPLILDLEENWSDYLHIAFCGECNYVLYSHAFGICWYMVWWCEYMTYNSSWYLITWYDTLYQYTMCFMIEQLWVIWIFRYRVFDLKLIKSISLI